MIDRASSEHDPTQFRDLTKKNMREILETPWLIFIPRRVDVRRLEALVSRGHSFFSRGDTPVRVLDVGGGGGFVDKFLAQEFRDSKIRFLITNVDKDKEALQAARALHRNKQGMLFVHADAEEEGVEMFPDPADLLIVSWPKPKSPMRADYAFTEIIHRNKPAFVVWIGDRVVGDLTSEFDTRDQYRPIASWSGRHKEELTSRLSLHGSTPHPVNGDNFFTVYARTDIPEALVKDTQEALKVIPTNVDRFPWEEDLQKMFPRDSGEVSFDVKRRILGEENS